MGAAWNSSADPHLATRDHRPLRRPLTPDPPRDARPLAFTDSGCWRRRSGGPTTRCHVRECPAPVGRPCASDYPSPAARRSGWALDLGGESRHRDSNPEPPDYKSGALPVAPCRPAVAALPGGAPTSVSLAPSPSGLTAPIAAGPSSRRRTLPSRNAVVQASRRSFKTMKFRCASKGAAARPITKSTVRSTPTTLKPNVTLNTLPVIVQGSPACSSGDRVMSARAGSAIGPRVSPRPGSPARPPFPPCSTTCSTP